MRALTLLLLPLLAVASPPRPPALLVLRAACDARAPVSPAPPAAQLLVLSYHETCGPGWSERVTRAALATMSGGGTVTMVGWPGAAACEALGATAHALHAARPAACALGSARAAAVTRLAARLGWRRAALPPAPPRSECRAALREVARALRAAGLTTAPLHNSHWDHQDQVEIQCVSSQRGVSGDRDASMKSTATVLLLHVEEPVAVEYDAPTPLAGSEPRAPIVGEPAFTTPGVLTRKRRLFLDSAGKNKNMSEYLIIEKKGDNSFGTSENEKPRSDPRKHRRLDSIFSYIDEKLPRRDLLLLTDESQDDDGAERDFERMYEETVAAIRRAEVVTSDAAASGETADFTFHVWRRAATAPGAWARVASFTTESTLSAEDTREWLTEVYARNATDALGRRAGNEDGAETHGASAVAATLFAASSVVLAMAATTAVALAVRWVAARRRRRRRGGDAVLDPRDFSFPADERRCVGDGMETMLSCWLQQLHEFGGPELERPDLLKQPPAVRASSVPSSTCSVNRLAPDRRVRYKGDAVHVKLLEVGGDDGVMAAGGLDLKRKAIDVLLLMQGLRHENLNPFIGCLCVARATGGPALVWDHCGRGSLEDVLMADDIKLDWTFRLSLLTDLVKGMRYLHASPLRVHGRLSSRNCVVDSRWVLRLTDYGLGGFARAQQLPPSAPPAARDLLWTAPELLRDTEARARGSQSGDVYSFAIIMQEVIVRGEPYCMLALSPEEIVEKLQRPPPLIRPSVSMGAAPPEAVSVMRQCWSEAPDMRPDFTRLHDLFRHLHRGRKINIVDSMFEMLEKYSNNLEELIRERTEQLDMEKKKTEQLLNRMLPRSVAERLLAGSRVEPEEFSDVSIYFSDIVGFTALAARSSPVQVVDLLNDLYTTFDAAIERYHVYKVETIGDAYMVVGGLPARARDHACSVATMALHLLHLAGRFRVRHLPDTPLHLRIGLHSGPCCAAVVGLTMPRYCLFGDTVNTASRMESTGAAWRIQVSAATAERLAAAGGYRLRSRGLVMIKGKGAMHTFWLLGKEGFDKPLPTPPPLPSEEVLFETDGENESELSSCSPPAAPAPTPAPVAGIAPALTLSPTEVPAPDTLDPSANQHEQGRRRSGAVSADSSPPGAGAGPPSRMVSAASVDRGAAYARYRWGGGGAAAVLRRQWSLERGEALATAAAERVPPDPAAAPPAPLALLTGAGARAPPPRYRTRPEPTDEPLAP